MDKEIQRLINLSENLNLDEGTLERTGSVDQVLKSLQIAMKGSSSVTARMRKNKYGDIEYTITQED